MDLSKQPSRTPTAVRPDDADGTAESCTTPLSPGSHLGPYEIIAKIGAGGMGEVYKARDTRLNRLVAIKTSAERFNDRFAN